MDDWIELVHPGEQLAEMLDEMGITAYRLSKSIGVPQDRVSKILKGKRGISPDSSIRLGRFFGQSPGFWLHLQTDYDLRQAQRSLGNLSEIQPIKSA